MHRVKTMAYLDNPKNNTFFMVLLIAIILIITFLGGHFSHDIYDKLKDAM